MQADSAAIEEVEKDENYFNDENFKIDGKKFSRGQEVTLMERPL